MSGAYYQDLDRGHFDYDLHAVPGIPGLQFRGPEFDPARPYVACVGAAQTFGRFCDSPFPSLLASRFGMQFLNLGVGGVGPSFFDTDPFLGVLNKAELVIVQMLSGRSEGNSRFDNRSTGSLLGVRRHDGKEMRFEDFLAELLQDESIEIVRESVKETRSNFVLHMRGLLEKITPPKILLWFSTRAPQYREGYSSVWELLGEFPQLVNAEMVEQIRHSADAYVECVSTAGLPQTLWQSDRPIDGTSAENGELVNRYYPSPIMHQEAAEVLAAACKTLLQEPVRRPASHSLQASPGRFIVLSAVRTGSNLLCDLLRANPRVFVGGEIFNTVFYDPPHIPWDVDASSADGTSTNSDQRLIGLRETEPGRFIAELYDRSRASGFEAVGFKCMYWQPDVDDAAARFLAGEKDVRVIHLKRKNLLRRLVSMRRAEATGQWAFSKNERPAALPSMQLSLAECVADFMAVEEKTREYDRLFQHHEVLQLTYEELAADPVEVAARALEFIGMDVPAGIGTRFAKSGVDPLDDAVANYEELKGTFARWASFFER